MDRNEIAMKFAVARVSADIDNSRDQGDPARIVDFGFACADAFLAASQPAPAASEAQRPEWVRITAKGFFSPLVREVVRWDGENPVVSGYYANGNKDDATFTLNDYEWEPCPAPSSPPSCEATPRPGAGEVFTCPKCGSHEFGTSNCTSPYSEWVGHCGNCRFSWPREKDDATYFAAPSSPPSCEATPRPEWVRVVSKNGWETTPFTIGKVYRVERWSKAGRPEVMNDEGGCWELSLRGDKPDDKFSTFASWVPAEPPRSVGRAMLAAKIRLAYTGFDDWPDAPDAVRDDWLRAADAAIAYFKNGGV